MNTKILCPISWADPIDNKGELKNEDKNERANNSAVEI
jgi:hypothetical protein